MMNIEALRELLLEIEQEAPCEIAKFSRLPMKVIRLPTRSPDGRFLGPRDIPQEQLKEQVGSKEYVEVKVLATQLGDEERLLFEHLKELKLVVMANKPVANSFDSIQPRAHNQFTPRVLGLTAKAAEFLELSSHRARLDQALRSLHASKSLSFSNLFNELKRMAKRDKPEQKSRGPVL